MWLLSTNRAELEFFSGPDDEALLKAGGYAILSHVWHGEEQSFQDVQALRARSTISNDTPRSRVSTKIRKCCELAERHGFHWVWIDTCCIDKTSSAELSEAINSMFSWYFEAGICYAYLEDIPSSLTAEREFTNSEWFRRGWTVQELIAPPVLLFLSQDWSIIGHKSRFAKVLESSTGIDASILLHDKKLADISISTRMSWADDRQTRRVEDRAYSLMGLFGVHMPVIYGEGLASFYRLQEEIMKLNDDQTIFAWGRACRLIDLPDLDSGTANDPRWDDHPATYLLASHADHFDRHRLDPISIDDAVADVERSLANLWSVVHI